MALTIPEAEFCRLLAGTDRTAETCARAYAEAFGAEARPEGRAATEAVNALLGREDIGFEVKCRDAQARHLRATIAAALAPLALDLAKAELAAREKTYLAIIGDLDLILKRQAAEQRLNPAESRFLEVAARATGIFGGDSININVPGVSAELADKMEAERRALYEELRAGATS